MLARTADNLYWLARYVERGMSSHDAAIKAMGELFGPVIGITLVLMSVFIPAAFVPGLTGQMFAQFALVIAATAFISAVNAATLKPTQCALWLRPAVPPEKRNFFFRGFNTVYQKFEDGYAYVIGAMVHRSGDQRRAAVDVDRMRAAAGAPIVGHGNHEQEVGDEGRRDGYRHRRRAGRSDARLSPGAGRHRYGGAGEARRFPA